MIPLRDNIRIRSYPIITLLLIAGNIYVFGNEMLFSAPAMTEFISRFGLVPADLIMGIAKNPLNYAIYIPLVSNLFLHGSISHILSNMWYLWIFGRTSEACIGPLRFISFYIICGVGANLFQIAFDPYSTIPTIGASGAVSGILGSYLTCFPRAKIITLIPLLLVFPVIEIPATLFIGFWFLIQLYHGTVTALFLAGTSIAWWAHIGGFICGMIFSRFFARRV